MNSESLPSEYNDLLERIAPTPEHGEILKSCWLAEYNEKKKKDSRAFLTYIVLISAIGPWLFYGLFHYTNWNFARTVIDFLYYVNIFFLLVIYHGFMKSLGDRREGQWKKLTIQEIKSYRLSSGELTIGWPDFRLGGSVSLLFTMLGANAWLYGRGNGGLFLAGATALVFFLSYRLAENIRSSTPKMLDHIIEMERKEAFTKAF